MRFFCQLRKKSKKRNNRSRNVRHTCRLEQLERREMFSGVTAAGDFNGDGYDDLAVAYPYADVGSATEAGKVEVTYGSRSGAASRPQVWHQDSTNILGLSESGDHFGYSLAAGDFNNDGYDDLAIGVPHESVGHSTYIGGQSDAGAVRVIYGSSYGLTARGDQIWFQNSPGIPGKSEVGDLFGWSLAAGDFNGDGHDDLAIGAPGENLGWKDDAGAVNVIYGSSKGLNAANSQVFTQDSKGMRGGSEINDFFGWSLAAGDFDNDGRDDLAVGVPYENVGWKKDAGAVNVIYGSPSGLDPSDSWMAAVGEVFFGPGRYRLFYQDVGEIAGKSEKCDYFGWSLAAGDFNNDGYDDLAIGAPGENVEASYRWHWNWWRTTVIKTPGKTDVGAVHAIYGSFAGLDPEITKDQIWVGRFAYDNLGYSLAAGDFNGDGHDDLAIGVPKAGDVSEGQIKVKDGSSGGLTTGRTIHLDHVADGIGDDYLDFLSDIDDGEKYWARWSMAAGDFDNDGYDDLVVKMPYRRELRHDWETVVNVYKGSRNGVSTSIDYVVKDYLFSSDGIFSEDDDEQRDVRIMPTDDSHELDVL